MPKVTRDKLYDAIIEVALEKFAEAKNLQPYLVTRPEGTPLYRYVSYRNSEPQIEKAGRTIWTKLEDDVDNRWTGRGPAKDAKGKQGVYLSGEYLDIEKPFPELEHYIKKDANLNDPVFYYRYQKGVAPELVLGTVGELRTMFLFTAKQELKGVDLRLDNAGQHPLLQDIFNTARKRNPDAFHEADTLASVYNAGEDASFCRAIGNAALEKTGADFFQTTSVRDQISVNVIMGGETGVAIPSLTPQGRASFFLNKQGGVEGVFTILDLQYNAAFEQSGLGVLPPRQEIEANLRDIASQMAERLVDAYQDALATQPPTDRMEQIGVRLQTLRDKLDNNNVGDALSAIGEIQTKIQEYQKGGGLQAIEANSFRTVDYVMKSMKNITESIDAAQNEPVEDPDQIPDDIKDIDFEDPDSNQVEPHIVEE